MTVAERGFIDVEVPGFTIDRVLVAVGLCESRGAAQRLVKQKGVSWRRDDGSDWSVVTDFKQEVEAGWPVVLRVGNGHWRTVQVEVEVVENPPLGSSEKPKVKKVTKPKMFNSLALVMRPMEDQTKDVWTELWD